MAFFSGLKKVEPSFNVQKAVMTIVLAAVGADGEVDDEEVRRLRSMCARSPLFSSNSREEDDAVIDFAVKMLNQNGLSILSKAAATLKPPLRETAFAFAVEMVLADGVVGADEEAFIGKLAEALEVSEAVGSTIVDVTMIRLRGAE